MTKRTFKFAAIFGQGNILRTRQIITANREPEKLSRIPPSFIVMDLTWKCNYHCGCCIDRNVVNKDSGELKPELIEDIFNYSKKKGVRGVMTMGGEVFLYKEGIETALRKSIECAVPVKTVTNGSCLKDYVPLILKAYRVPGSMLRVSINSDKKHYKEQTGENYDLEEVLGSIKTITSQGTPVYVSTVVYPESSRKDGTTPNIPSLPEIIEYCEEAGVKTQILLPARNPETRARYPRTDEERKVMQEIMKKEYKHELGIDDFRIRNFPCKQNLDFSYCPSGFLFTLVGSDGRIYKCTDSRGMESMVIGHIENPGDFEKFWHSQERVNNQMCTKCTHCGCGRYEINSLLDGCCETFCRRGLDLSEYLEMEGFQDKIFI